MTTWMKKTYRQVAVSEAGALHNAGTGQPHTRTHYRCSGCGSEYFSEIADPLDEIEHAPEAEEFLQSHRLFSNCPLPTSA